MKELLELIIKSIVENKKEVKISSENKEDGIFFHIDVNKEEIGKIIGKEGRTISAIRTLLKIKALKEGTKAFVDVVSKQKEA